MKKPTLLIALLLLCSNTIFSQKDTCKVGIYLNSVYDFNPGDKCFTTDFWMWMNYKNDSLNFDGALELPNSITADFSHFSVEKKGEWNWASQKCKAQIMQHWDVSKFPFDKQHLFIELEGAQYDASQLVFVPDTLNSKIDCSFNSNEWQVEKFSINAIEKTYNTTYGNPELIGTSSYPRVVAEVIIRRNNSWLMLFKMLTGAYVAFLISCLVFFVSSENQDSRFGLCVGGLFAAIGNKYIVESVLPTSNTNTLMDNVHNLTFVFILLIVGVIIISLNLFESGDETRKQKSIKLDKWAFYSIISIYILINIFLVWRSAS